MYLVELTYISELNEIDEHLEAHRDFLNKYLKAQKLLLAGRKNPRNGGLIVFSAESTSEVEQIIAKDPFKIHNLAEYRIIEFIPSVTAEILNSVANL